MKDLTMDDTTIEWLGVRYKTILGPADTGGAMSIVDSLSPVGSGPPRHVHHNEDEIFVILSGTCRLWMQGEETDLLAGQSAFIPRGKEHTFKAIGDEPCRHLVILTPGGFEGFFADMAAGQFAIPDDMPAIAESAERHHMTFTGPPLD
ncbi:cupin domain-containing protein [Histidinibacterium aquaticum]|uniref:Cupin domain-containing protein n=1 Tax=Histidinibacterium aquaticum TaxID=2613962 RepID=A0A5J5GRC1_9RHOB|nr:cupin domain-containing protein [Histidinibacterium aquaticum]KAA9010108.1 cupin domain-containing protein [Histidinibacterium aquaticum]